MAQQNPEPEYMARMPPEMWWRTLFDGSEDSFTIRDYDADKPGRVLLHIDRGNGSPEALQAANAVGTLAASAPYMLSLLTVIKYYLMDNPDALPDQLKAAIDMEVKYAERFYLRPQRPEFPRRIEEHEP